MNLLIIDGQGGNLGRQLVKMISAKYPEQSLMIVGTNGIATANMLKGGPAHAATGENAAIVCARKADIIIGPIGIVIADALMGEVTPAMATAIGQSNAVRILIPMDRCETLIAGMENKTTAELLEAAVRRLDELLK